MNAKIETLSHGIFKTAADGSRELVDEVSGPDPTAAARRVQDWQRLHPSSSFEAVAYQRTTHAAGTTSTGYRTAKCVRCGMRLGLDCGEAEPDYDARHCSKGCFHLHAAARRAHAGAPDPAAVLELLEAYAENGCGTYPAETDLIREVFPDGAPGYVLTECPGWAGGPPDFTVARAVTA